MTKPNTNKTKTSAPTAEPQGDNTKPVDGEPTGLNMTDNAQATQTETSAPAAEPKGDNTKPADGELTGPNMTEQEYDVLTSTASQEKAPPKTGNREIKGKGSISSAATLRTAEPSRVEIAATIAAGMLGQGRYTALLRDDRIVHDLAANSLRVADALIAAAEPQA